MKNLEKFDFSNFSKKLGNKQKKQNLISIFIVDIFLPSIFPNIFDKVHARRVKSLDRRKFQYKIDIPRNSNLIPVHSNSIPVYSNSIPRHLTFY